MGEGKRHYGGFLSHSGSHNRTPFHSILFKSLILKLGIMRVMNREGCGLSHIHLFVPTGVLCITIHRFSLMYRSVPNFLLSPLRTHIPRSWGCGCGWLINANGCHSAVWQQLLIGSLLFERRLYVMLQSNNSMQQWRSIQLPTSLHDLINQLLLQLWRLS